MNQVYWFQTEIANTFKNYPLLGFEIVLNSCINNYLKRLLKYRHEGGIINLHIFHGGSSQRSPGVDARTSFTNRTAPVHCCPAALPSARR